MRRGTALAAALVLAAACTSSSPAPRPSSPGQTTPFEEHLPGPTLQVALARDVSAAFDPQKEYDQIAWEFFRCCLLRTLLSYNGKPASQGGDILRPDLASRLPTISANGMTWTFHVKPGVHYSPPLEDLTVKSGDIVRALEREACQVCSAGGYPLYYSVIRGFEAVYDGKARSISGLETPDDQTLVVRLKRPNADLGYLFALPATAPIPPNPSRPQARLGVATGHNPSYGRFLIATGPYMFKNQEALDFSVPPRNQPSVTGYVRGKSITLLRNPSWDASTDSLRVAAPDEILARETSGSPDELLTRVQAGSLDLVLRADPLTFGPILRSLGGSVSGLHVNPTRTLTYISMNLAAPPFDDVHVRRAIQYVIDKDGLRAPAGGPTAGLIANHIFPHDLEGNRLRTYRPYVTPNSEGDVARARSEMRVSRYDSNHDGRCDDPTCRNVTTVFPEIAPAALELKTIADGLSQIGIEIDPITFVGRGVAARCDDPTAQIPLCLGQSWGQDFPDAASFARPLFSGRSIGQGSCCNYSLVGASPAQLSRWRYHVRRVPGVDDRIRRCEAQKGDPEARCWASLDRYLMNTIVPMVPLMFDQNIDITSSRVSSYSFDAFTGMAALDRLALEPA